MTKIWGKGSRLPGILVLVLIFIGCGKSGQQRPVKAEDAISTIQVPAGFKVELIAAEPLISDPVDMEIDEYGRLYVVEMHGYPLDKTGSGKIILLSDADGDGVMDKRSVYKEGMVLPTSIMRWKKGVIVTDAPHIIYFEDADGDGKAELSDTLVSGFALTNPQHNLNTPVYGLDNWVYVAHEPSVSTKTYEEEFGDKGTQIFMPHFPGGPKLPQNANGRSIRFRPDTAKLEMLSGSCQFGQTFDQWGHLFGCNNSNHIYQEIIASRYFERNPHLFISNASHDNSDHLNAAEVFPTTTRPDRQLLTNVGVMTSACGLTGYMANAFPEPYNSNVVFVAEPVSNLVHVDVVNETGITYKASRILDRKEFFTSTDSWSRPVNMYVGPDGALYILDYYRRVIESPEWMSEEAINAGDLYDGADMGRIFRVSATDGPAAEWTKGLSMGNATTTELASMLSHESHWWRINAQRLLVDRADPGCVPLLERMAESDPSDMGRLHALWTLEGIQQLKPGLISKVLKDRVAGIRENAIRLAELHLQEDPGLVEQLYTMANDPDKKVRFQLLLTLGFVETPLAEETRNRMLFANMNDKWFQVAALTAPLKNASGLLQKTLERYEKGNEAYSSLVQRLANMLAFSGNDKEIFTLILKSTDKDASGKKPWQYPLLEGLAEGIRNRKDLVDISAALQERITNVFFEHPSVDVRRACFHLLRSTGLTAKTVKDKAIPRALKMMNDSTANERLRALAVEFLSLDEPGLFVKELENLVVPNEHLMVQLAALKTLSLVPGTSTTQYVIKQWPTLTAEVRKEAIGTFLNDAGRVHLLLTAIEQGNINPGSVGFDNSVQLMLHEDTVLRKRARKLLAPDSDQRQHTIENYRSSTETDGDPVRGKEVYMKNCAICHQVRGKMGVAFGPDLGTIHNWLKEDILVNVIDPNLSISAGFDLWKLELNTGEIVQGIIINETPAAITIKNNEKPQRLINRQEIKSMNATNISAMPAGLEKNINTDEMADLLAFLRQH